MLETVLLLLIAASWVYWLIAWWATRVFFRARTEVDPGYAPPVSILKPVRGVDAEAYQNLASFCRQDYPVVELLFGVADPHDPVMPILKRLQQDFPECRIRLVSGPAIGSNCKVSLLHHLAAQANHDVLVISDSDMRVTPDYLRWLVAPLADEQIGLVTCPYRGGAPSGLAAQLEALHMGITFLPSVVVASQLLHMPVAMGATMALRRGDLAGIGGFEAIADYLADDYQLGVRIARLGRGVHLSSYVMTSVLGKTTFREQWHREVRWARCTRVSRPWEYPGLLLTFSTPLALILVLFSGLAAIGWLALAVSLLLRWLVAWRVPEYTGDRETRHWLIWLPLRDVWSALVWCAGILGRRIYWRGEQFVLHSNGRMQSLPSLEERAFGERHAW
jgi:ceramide glucosyltransferase